MNLNLVFKFFLFPLLVLHIRFRLSVFFRRFPMTKVVLVPAFMVKIILIRV